MARNLLCIFSIWIALNVAAAEKSCAGFLVGFPKISRFVNRITDVYLMVPNRWFLPKGVIEIVDDEITPRDLELIEFSKNHDFYEAKYAEAVGADNEVFMETEN